MNKKGFVYKWTNKLNGKWYIGSHGGSIDDKYVGSGIAFKKAYRKHGKDNFTREILMECDEYLELEEFILQELDAKNDRMSYNMKNSSLGQDKGYKIPNPSRKGNTNSYFGESNPNYGNKLSESNKKKISEARKKEKWKCDLCGREGVGFGNLSRWHGKYKCEDREYFTNKKGDVYIDHRVYKGNYNMRGSQNPNFKGNKYE